MRFLTLLLCLFCSVQAFAQGEGGYTAPPVSSFSQGLLTNTTAAGWTNALGVSGGGGSPSGSAGGDLTGTYPNPTLTNVITAGTAIVEQYDAKGRVIATNALTAGMIPNLAASQITSGTFTTNLLPSPLPIGIGGTGSSTGNASGLTNVFLGDGGATGLAAGVAVFSLGSSNGMQPNIIRSVVYANGSTSGYNDGGDSANIAINEATNFSDSGGGWGVSVMGGGNGSTLGANIINQVAGITMVQLPTNRFSQLIPGFNYFVFSEDSINNKGTGWCSPGFNDAASLDQGNYFGWLVDAEHGFTGMPLLNAGQAGVYQPDDVVYQFTVTNVTGTLPTFENSVYANNGHYYTSYSNNISGGNGSIMMTSAYGAPAASGTLTNVYGPTQSTIGFTASAAIRSWSWGVKFSPSTGNAAFNGYIDSRSAQIGTHLPITNNAGNVFTSSNTTGFYMLPSNNVASGKTAFTIQESRGIYSAAFGVGDGYFMTAIQGNQPANNSYYPSSAMPQICFGGNELSDQNNWGSCDVEHHGSIGTMITNSAASRTLTIDDSTVVVKASGVIAIALPDATGNIGTNAIKGKYRYYQLLNDGTTNFTITTTSNLGFSTNLETIGLNTTQTNLTVVPGQALQVQSDGSNWKFTYSPGLVQTNWVSGQLYTNTYGRVIEVSTSAILSPASVSGTVAGWLESSGYQTNFYSEGTVVGTIVAPMTNNLRMWIPAGNTFDFTNKSSGAGNAFTIAGGQLFVP